MIQGEVPPWRMQNTLWESTKAGTHCKNFLFHKCCCKKCASLFGMLHRRNDVPINWSQAEIHRSAKWNPCAVIPVMYSFCCRCRSPSEAWKQMFQWDFHSWEALWWVWSPKSLSNTFVGFWMTGRGRMRHIYALCITFTHSCIWRSSSLCHYNVCFFFLFFFSCTTYHFIEKSSIFL